ncbi:hypothetical protein MHBO_003123 [Bonamia ostreae]|uniref:Uncharacterized protein n=1 Tax=Bonamia ostreae TaxID=126728 RepID=A0ABV2AQF9_9EUKA
MNITIKNEFKSKLLKTNEKPKFHQKKERIRELASKGIKILETILKNNPEKSMKQLCTVSKEKFEENFSIK